MDIFRLIDTVVASLQHYHKRSSKRQEPTKPHPEATKLLAAAHHRLILEALHHARGLVKLLLSAYSSLVLSASGIEFPSSKHVSMLFKHHMSALCQLDGPHHGLRHGTHHTHFTKADAILLR